ATWRQRRLRTIAARAVDEDADRSPLFGDGVSRTQQRIAVNGVGGLEDCSTAGLLDAAHALAAALRIAANDRDARSGVGQRLGHRAAQDARAAENHGRFIL